MRCWRNRIILLGHAAPAGCERSHEDCQIRHSKHRLSVRAHVEEYPCLQQGKGTRQVEGRTCVAAGLECRACQAPQACAQSTTITARGSGARTARSSGSASVGGTLASWSRSRCWGSSSCAATAAATLSAPPHLIHSFLTQRMICHNSYLCIDSKQQLPGNGLHQGDPATPQSPQIPEDRGDPTSIGCRAMPGQWQPSRQTLNSKTIRSASRWCCT